MKSTILKAALGAAMLCSVTSVFAHLAQSVQSPAFCPAPSQCLVSSGDQLARGASSNAAITLHATALKQGETVPSNDVPEPGSLALMGIGALAVGYISRRYGAKKP
jgi:hypothetical protein